MKTHYLKAWLEYFNDVCENKKKFELRKNDRDFQIGDEVVLQAWDNEEGKYTGYYYRITIKYILHGGQFGLEEGYCILNW